MTLDTISSKGYIDAPHIEDACAIDDTSDTSGINGLPKTKKYSPEQLRNYNNVGYGIPLQNFQSKLAQVKKGLISKVRIFCISDSTGGGKGAGGGDPWGNSWPAVLTQLFNKAGFNATNAAFYASGDGTNASSTYNSARLTLGSSWGTQATPTLGGDLYVATTTTNALSFKPTEYWDTAIISYLTSSAQGTFSTDIDGAGTTNTNGNGSNGNARFTQTTALAGIHTLNYKYVSGTKAFVSGVECYNSNLNQVMIVNCGWGGVTTATLATNNNPFDPLGALEFQAPDLTIFGTVINDWLQTQDIPTLKINVAALITAARLSGDCIWMLSVPSGITNTALATQQAYAAAIRGVCLTNNVPVVDIFDRFQSYEISELLNLYSDTIHPNGAGYDIMAKAVFDALNVKGYSANIMGITDGSTAKAGCIGELISSKVASGSAVSVSTATITDVTSITLQPGDHTIKPVIAFKGNITGTIFQSFIGTASGNSSTGQDTALNTVQTTVAPTTACDVIMTLPAFDVNITVPTTYYLKANSTYSGGTLTAYGSMSARRNPR